MKRAKELADGEGFDVVIEDSSSKVGVMLLPDVCRTDGALMALSLSSLP